MSDSGGIPELQCSQPDGRPRTRIEMDEWLRKEVPKVHWLRIHAKRTFNLPAQIAWDMREIVLRHWILDEMIRKQLITGDLLGVNPNTSNDEAELRQFTQRLAALIQTSQAVQPQHAEGVDMNGYTPPPPPVMGGAPQATYPSGPPAPPGVPTGVPGGYPGAPQFQPPPGPPTATPPGYAPPPSGVPSMGPPQMQQSPAPIGPPGVPQAGPPAPPVGGRRKRTDAPQQLAPPAAPVPPMGVPQGFAPAGYAQPPAPQGFAPQVPVAAPQAAPPQQAYQQAPQAAPQVDLIGVLVKLDQVLNNLNSLAARNAVLERKVELLSMMNTVLCRGIYQKQGNADAAAFLTELGVPLPQ